MEKYGSDFIKDKYLKKLAIGEKLGAFSLSEPQSGSDASNMKTNAKKIIYCSCNPSTQVRDLNEFTNYGYKLNKIRPVDMFPNTPHIECVTTLIHDK